MKFLNNQELLKKYILKYDINNIFQSNMQKHMQLIKYQKSEPIFLEGDKLEYFYFVVDGNIKIYSLLQNGRKILLRFIKPFGTLGEIELMGDYLSKNNAEVVNDPSLLIGIKISDIEKYALEDTQFLKFINKLLSYKLVTIDNTMALNLAYPLKARLASYLITLVSGKERRIKEIQTSDLSDMADLLGSSKRHLTRVIKDLSKSKIIEKNDKIITIKNYNKLKELSLELFE